MEPRRNLTRMARYRSRLRTLGLRPVQIWVPDTTRPGFAEEVRRQCEEINRIEEEERVMDWVEAVSIFDEDDSR
jgi:hypothetical protein